MRDSKKKSNNNNALLDTDIKYPEPKPFLKRGGGKLASDFHGETEFAKQRKLKIIKEQEERESKGYN